MSAWAEQRRADRVADREQDRIDAAAAAEQHRADRAELAAASRTDRTERTQARERRRDAAKARRTALTGWTAAHAVDLLIYPLAAVSAVMAVPAMAAYGMKIYGGATGAVLPVLTEAGMWAFALAVMVSRRHTPDRPTGALTVGIGVFAAVGAGLNFAHGIAGGAVHAAVMAVVSVAGVVAHQLAVAAPRRSRVERTARRLDRAAYRRVARARRAAIRRAVVELTADGTATLLYAPGQYMPHRRRLAPAVVPGLPVNDPDDWDAALAELVDADPTELADSPDPTTEADLHECGDESAGGSGGVALADPPAPVDSTPASKRRPIDPQARRRVTSDEALRAARRIARKHGEPVTAAQLRKALQVGATTARALRDQVNGELYGGTS